MENYDVVYLGLDGKRNINSLCDELSWRKKKLLICLENEVVSNPNLLLKVYKIEDNLKARYGFESIAYQCNMNNPIVNLDILQRVVNKNNIPLKIDLMVEDFIKNTSLIINSFNCLKDYSDKLSENEDLLKKIDDFFETSDFCQVSCPIIESCNDSQYDLAMAMYYLEKYGFPIRLIKIDDVAKKDYWCNIISDNDFNISDGNDCKVIRKVYKG